MKRQSKDVSGNLSKHLLKMFTNYLEGFFLLMEYLSFMSQLTEQLKNEGEDLK